MHACYGELLKALCNVCGFMPLLLYAALAILFQLSNNLLTFSVTLKANQTGFFTLQYFFAGVLFPYVNKDTHRLIGTRLQLKQILKLATNFLP